ncbi:Alanine--glyoxylate aminotransferase 1 [Grifola frondosa]|uniref:Alanine--glyoxylate aminotransferase 1 n=1 Tax=Grifola frondosa TaxID=5627 RepID=A0A1C7MA82_GRIFR|nr:Alanine--glyoxylate aminotransferase 1 [Grifola frondosa]
MSTFTQAPHKLLVIPGPIEVTDEVLYANAHPSVSHTAPDFIPVFGDCIRMLRDILYTTTAQPFIISGSGTLGWDQVASNLVEPGENALVLNSGYFGDSFSECLRIYGANVDEVHAAFGTVASLSLVEKALKSRKYKILAFTHVDTSTGVLSDAKAIAEVVQRVSPATLVVCDGVCSVASEEIRMDAWGLDVVLTAIRRQLSLSDEGCPRDVLLRSWKKWLPIMQAYEKGAPSYFATPPVNLIYAFNESLTQITKRSPSLEERFQLHREASKRIKDTVAELGLKQLALDPAHAANGMTAVYFPAGLGAADVLPRLAKRNVLVAGGLHKDAKERYFRIGHMGVTVTDKQRGDIDTVITALKESIAEAKASQNVVENRARYYPALFPPRACDSHGARQCMSCRPPSPANTQYRAPVAVAARRRDSAFRKRGDRGERTLATPSDAMTSHVQHSCIMDNLIQGHS